MQIRTQLAITSFTLLLMACGGGSGSHSATGGTGNTSGSGDDVVVSPPIPPVQKEDLQTVVPVPTYDVNSANFSSFNEINAFRASLGLGLWSQNLLLDKAAKNHVDYELLNREYGHDETPGKPGFTGVDATERAVFAGYSSSYWVGDLGTATVGSVRTLINTVYHRSYLMSQEMSEVGIANSPNPTDPVQFISFSNALKIQSNASDYQAVYPLDGQTNVPVFMMGESVDPFPEIPLPSSPISFASVAGSKLSVTHFTVTQEGQDSPLPTQLRTQDNDPNPGYLPAHEAYLVGIVPFATYTTYQVHFDGLIDSTPVSRDWHFTTSARR